MVFGQTENEPHVPPTHERVPPHEMPHPPQFAASDFVSTQVPLQSVSPELHPHVEPEQISVEPHA